MDVVRVLPPEVVDQIAAGEVIERPASVVKELVDNAVDAGARTVVIETAAGGRALVRVTDDGCGMSPADARAALLPHATSKLRAVDELWGLPTMGFRGEALPSIASVARLVLTTRRADDLAATRVVVAAGRVESVSEVGAAVGTTVEITELFGCVPARLKFLKGEGTEASHVTELVAKIAMAHPALHVRLRHNGRTALELPPDRDGFARAQALLGSKVAARMVPVSGEDGGVRVSAFLAAPELAQTTARGVQLFVGRRPVRDRGLLHAVAMGYGELVPRGRYPVAVVCVDVPAGAVDINVHPQKVEVRFADAGAVCAAVRHVVQAGVARAPWRGEVAGAMMTAVASVAPPQLPWDGESATPLARRYAAELASARGGQRSLGLEAAGAAREWVREVKSAVRAGRAADEAAVYAKAKPAVGLFPDAAAADRAPHAAADGRSPQPSADSRTPQPFAAAAGPGYFASLRFLGQVDLTYLVCEGNGELVLLDQHVAHERIELARLAQTDAGGDVAVQKLLFPTTLDATAAELELVERARGVLAQIGFEAEAFGAATIALKAVPANLRHGDPAQLLRTLLDQWAASGAPSEAELLERARSEIACHSVVRAGDRLDAREAEALLRQLDAIDPDTPNPHGRPVLLRLPLVEIGRRFGR
jgi:DNA mismatch repair protein MutL